MSYEILTFVAGIILGIWINELLHYYRDKK